MKFSKWLEQRDPELHHNVVNEVNWLNLLGGSGAVLSNILALSQSMGVDPQLLAKKYMQQHGHAASMHSPSASHAQPGSHDPHTGGPDPYKGRSLSDRHGHGHDHGHDDHGHDHTDHLHAHFFGDKEREEEDEKMRHLMDKLGNKKGPAGPVTLPTMGPGGDGSHEDDMDFNVPPEINIPGVGRRPGISPISTGQAQYQQLMAGQKPSVPENPFDFSADAPAAAVNPQVSKFASRMQKRRQ